MRWEPWGKYAIRTDTHSISKALVRGEWIYTLWKLPAEVIGSFKSAELAKAACIGLDADSQETPAQIGTTNRGAMREQDY